ncbi:DUF6361 family protein [Actinoplanes sp. GCM10030250]|uniref:DUF6361 family protein n=1 Tax=Actinoplanes sp. GCM10030250 TaxID=3273376 RepID=UPI0036083655
MPSQLSWLDSSRAEQQRMRELLNMFSEHESRDELGIGQVRDAFGDMLFPGTSTLHTRARYLLIVPWCVDQAERRAGRGKQADTDSVERKVIQVLKAAGATDGLIGRRASTGVKTLPSTIYRSALRHYGIDSEWITTEASGIEAGELTDRAWGRWPATLPPPGPGFPDDLAGLELTAEEAGWLRETIMASVPGTLLEHLLKQGSKPDADMWAPWLDAAVAGAPSDPATALEHARCFSTCLHGAALLYNLILTEEYEQAGHTGIEFYDYRDALAGWAEQMTEVSTWDRADMWARLISVNPRIAANATARRFIDTWIDLVLDGDPEQAADDQELRALVTRREKAVKKTQSRLLNGTLLRTWTGASGTRQLVFRWPQVRRMLIDIHEGTGSPDAVAA